MRKYISVVLVLIFSIAAEAVDVNQLYNTAIHNTPGLSGVYPLRLTSYPDAFWAVGNCDASPLHVPKTLVGHDFYHLFYDEVGPEYWWTAFTIQNLPFVAEAAHWFGEKGTDAYIPAATALENMFKNSSPDFGTTFNRFTSPIFFYHHLDFTGYLQGNYEQFLSSYSDRFMGCAMSEWGHGILSGSEWAAFNPSTRQQAYAYLETLYEAGFSRMMHDSGGVTQHYSLTGYQRFEHYAAQWGARVIAVELGENIPHSNREIAFARGASRQYDRPWMVDHSPWFLDGVGIDLGHDYQSGHSMSLARRQAYLAYMAGANVFWHENTNGGWKVNDNYTSDLVGNLTPRGQLLRDWYNTIKTINRGIPYTPVAIMLDFYHGIGTRPTNRWGKFAWTSSDWMDEHTFMLFYPNPAGHFPAWNDTHAEQQFQLNTPLGDIADVILPNAPGGISQELVNSYKVIVLSGDMENNATVISQLVSFVNQGGTLVLNSKHLSLSWPAGFTGVTAGGTAAANTAYCFKTGISFTTSNYTYKVVTLTTAQALMRASNSGTSAVIAAHNDYGQGHVVLTTPEYMLDQNQEGLPFYGHILAGVVNACMPLTVTGDIEYLINQNTDGYLVTLINNKGIYKLTFADPLIDANYTQIVKITFPMASKLSCASDVIAKLPLALATTSSKYELTVSIAPGELKIIQLSRAATNIGHGVIRYSFENGMPGVSATGSILDTSGNNYNATAVALNGDNATYEQGGFDADKSGTAVALNLEGNSQGGLGRDYINAGYRSKYKPGINSFTWEIMVKTPETLNFQNAEGYIIDLCGADTSRSRIAISMYGEMDAVKKGKVRFFVAQRRDTAAGRYDADSPTAINDGGWHQLAIVRDAGANTIKYYVDYQPIASFSDTVVRDISYFDMTRPLMLGATSPDMANGVELSIDELRISDTALPPEWFIGAGPQSCSEVVLHGYAQASDLNQDCRVNLKDLQILLENWLTLALE